MKNDLDTGFRRYDLNNNLDTGLRRYDIEGRKPAIADMTSE
jgi:hypothetical protein